MNKVNDSTIPKDSLVKYKTFFLHSPFPRRRLRGCLTYWNHVKPANCTQQFHFKVSTQVTTTLFDFFLGIEERDIRYQRSGYFPISECYSDYDCDYGMKCDSEFWFCIPVAGKHNDEN